jgi:hypothetical protein
MRYQSRFFTLLTTIGLVAVLDPTPASAASQVPPSAPVTVVNTSANPVPVTGSTTVSGSVTIANPSLTVDALNDTLNEPYIRGGSHSFSPTDLQITEAFDVPDGKRLIVESVTIRSATTANKAVIGQYAILKQVSGNVLSIGGDLSMTPAQGPIDGNYWSVGTHPIKLRIDAVPGVDHELNFYLQCDACDGTINVSVAGYLVPLPQ